MLIACGLLGFLRTYLKVPKKLVVVIWENQGCPEMHGTWQKGWQKQSDKGSKKRVALGGMRCPPSGLEHDFT